MARDPVTELGGEERSFPDTLWTAVLGAKDRQGPGFNDSLRRLVELYWKPVYWVIRSRWGKSNEEAKDLTQSFFASLLEKDRLKDVGPERGRFRSFVQVVLLNYLRNERAASRAAKRGGGARFVSLAGDDELPIPARGLTPSRLFERSWALCIFRETTEELAARYRALGKEKYFLVFERYDLAGEDPPTHEALALELGIRASDVDNYLRHARKAFREVLRARVRETLACDADLESELEALAAALGDEG